MDHQIATIKGTTLCTRCGRQEGFEFPCAGTHDITGYAGTLICKNADPRQHGRKRPVMAVMI